MRPVLAYAVDLGTNTVDGAFGGDGEEVAVSVDDARLAGQPTAKTLTGGGECVVDAAGARDLLPRVAHPGGTATLVGNRFASSMRGVLDQLGSVEQVHKQAAELAQAQSIEEQRSDARQAMQRRQQHLKETTPEPPSPGSSAVNSPQAGLEAEGATVADTVARAKAQTDAKAPPPPPRAGRANELKGLLPPQPAASVHYAATPLTATSDAGHAAARSEAAHHGVEEEPVRGPHKGLAGLGTYATADLTMQFDPSGSWRPLAKIIVGRLPAS